MESSDAEFDAYARWTAEAVQALGQDYAIPAGCRGSGSPAALAWLAEALALTSGRRFLDVGAGVGGAAAWLSQHYPVDVSCLEPMAGAVEACRSLFGLPAAVATAHALPVRSSTVPDMWALGVLSTTSQHAALLTELRRVLIPGGGLGLLVYATSKEEGGAPDDGQNFPAADALPDLLEDAGLGVVDILEASGLLDAPRSWSDRLEAVEAWIAARHEAESAWESATDGATQMAALLRGGDVCPLLVHARAR